MTGNMIYRVSDKPKRIGEWIGYIAQYFFCVLPATMLISRICGTSIAAGLVSAGIGTLTFLLITRLRCAMVTSNSGATVSAIVGTMALGKTVDAGMTGVVLGGLTMMIIYAIASLLVKKFGTNWLNKLMPPVVSGTTIIVIGASLTLFIPAYAQVNGEFSYWGIGVCFITMLVAALVGHYMKGIWKTLPFLVAIVVGDLLAILVTAFGLAPLVDFQAMIPQSVVSLPDFAFLHLNFTEFDWSTFPQIILMFGLVSLSAMTEHVADVTTASKIAEEDYLKNPGLHRTLLGDGVSSFVGSLTGTQMTTTYSEYTGTMAVSRVASAWVTLGTAITLIVFAFITPFTNFLASLPNCIIAGISILAYGAIANTGARTLIDSKVDFTKNRNLFIFAAMFSAGISGLAIPITDNFAVSGIVLAMIVGIVLNLILREKKVTTPEEVTVESSTDEKPSV